MADEPGAIDDDVADKAGELMKEAGEQLQQNREEQEAFLETVQAEEGAPVLETTCTLIGEITVDLEAKLDGELMDAMGRIDDRLERAEAGEARAYEISETADEVSQILADAVNDPAYDKRTFYQAYESEGLDALGVMLERAFEALKAEKERREGTADGFRTKQ
jgi:hypothetical protein